MTKCLNCGRDFESKRSTAKYCNAKCRKLAFRNAKVSVPLENAKSGIDVTDGIATIVTGKCKPNGSVEITDFRRELTDLPDGEYREQPETQTVTMTPEGPKSEVPRNYGLEDCECMHCRQRRTNKSHNIINHGPYKTAKGLGPDEINRVSLPGDVDYAGVCKQDDNGNWRVPKEAECTLACDSFETLPKDVQEDITRLTAWCKKKKIEDDLPKRIKRAIHYHIRATG